MPRRYLPILIQIVVILGLGGDPTRCQQPELVSINFAGSNSGNFISGTVAANTRSPGISEGGRFVVFESRATDLEPIDNIGWTDTYRSEVPNWGDWGCGALNIFMDGFDSGDTTQWSVTVPS